MTGGRFRLATLRNKRGSVLVLTVFAIVGLVGVAALAIDLGMLFTARSEAQRAAEAGAHAGAGVFLYAPNDVVTAREQARIFAENNFVRQEGVELQDEDIDVVPAEQLVRVRVNRIQARGNPVGTVFARVFGINDVDVGAVAAAQSWPAGGVSCMLPFAIPDRWSEGTSPAMVPPTTADRYGDEPADWYSPWDSLNPAESYTGYGVADRGTEIRLYASSPNQAPQPGWWYPMDFGSGANPNTDGVGAWITGCPHPNLSAELGEDMNVENGNMVGPIGRAFDELIAQDPNARWEQSANDENGCVTYGDGVCRGSPRIKPVLMFDPNYYPGTGKNTVTITNFVGVFVDRRLGNGGNIQVIVRFVEYVDVNPAEVWSASGPLVRVLRIVE
jgi:hypothetical protein